MITNKRDFMNALQRAKDMHTLMMNAQSAILSDLDVDLTTVPFDAVNANNLEDAIMCYIMYGEPPMSQNIDDFWVAYNHAVLDTND